MTIQTLFARAPVTLVLLIAIVVLFIWQAVTGVDINNPSSQDLVAWGANYFPLTFSGEPWRLITSALLHIGFMHLMFNGFALYFFGTAVESTFGSIKYLALFLLAAVGGNLLSGYLTWLDIQQLNFEAVGVSAGASGGIMGLGMAILTIEIFVYLRRKWLLKTRQHSADAIPSNLSQLKSMAVVMGINLAYGFVVPGIDNAGHIGGAIVGSILATALMFDLMGSRAKASITTAVHNAPKPKPKPQWLTWIAIIAMTLLFVLVYFGVHEQWQLFAMTHLA